MDRLSSNSTLPSQPKIIDFVTAAAAAQTANCRVIDTAPTGEARSLGIIAINPSHAQATAKPSRKTDPAAIARRFKLQRYAQDILRRINAKERVCQCMQSRIPEAEYVRVRVHTSKPKAAYGNLKVCKSPWGCPVCAVRLSEERKAELEQAIQAAKALGLFPLMLTFTLSHSQADRLTDTRAALRKAYEKTMTSGRWAKALREEYEWFGHVSSQEVTYSTNGWHPHLHVLALIGIELSGRFLTELKAEIYAQYNHWLKKLGYSGSFDHAVDVKAGDQAVGDYIAKGMWGLESEMTKGRVKTGRKDSLTPFDLLGVLNNETDQLARFKRVVGAEKTVDELKAKAEKLYAEYYAAMKGKQQLTWSNGLWDALGMDNRMKAVQDALDEEEAAMVDLILLDKPAWKAVCEANVRGELLEIAKTADFDALEAFLRDLGVTEIENYNARGNQQKFTPIGAFRPRIPNPA